MKININIKYIIVLLIIITIAICVMILKMNKKDITEKEQNVENIIIEKNKVENTEDQTLVININSTQEENEESEQENKKDAATLTQEIYSMNAPIGTLNIPKTAVNTKIYSNVTVDKMEEMPCFLYTTGGLNEIGTTLFVGHNRRNGKLFSDNKKLEIGDEFYFIDYNGKELKYTIFNKFIANEGDISFLNEEVQKPTIALSCCTDADDDNRIIILGRNE